jgi:hypothetical protein
LPAWAAGGPTIIAHPWARKDNDDLASAHRLD